MTDDSSVFVSRARTWLATQDNLGLFRVPTLMQALLAGFRWPSPILWVGLWIHGMSLVPACQAELTEVKALLAGRQSRPGGLDDSASARIAASLQRPDP
ncbi:MAG: hypothetical protein ACK53L_02380, partial [Pirellulaceae bacterium]